MLFGDELHRYSIADGNVFGFDPYKVLTYRNADLRKAIALNRAKAATVEEVLADLAKRSMYLRFSDKSLVPMAGYRDERGSWVKGIEEYVPNSQYNCDEHRREVIRDIFEQWVTLSLAGKFHAILATSSIPEAIAYYHPIKEQGSTFKVTALFDPSDTNKESDFLKEEGLAEIVEDYNALYGTEYALGSYEFFKKDVAQRLAHKAPYQGVGRTPEKQLDLLIVVNQMLTGFDSKWVNTLYLDKVLRYEGLI